jgi:hypothetical protein
MLSGISSQLFRFQESAFIHDQLVYPLAGHPKVLREACLAPRHERPVLEHVPDRLPELLGALGIPFGHGLFSDTLDRNKNGGREALLRSAQRVICEGILARHP